MENQPKIDPSKIYPDALSDEELKRKRCEEEAQTMLDFRRQKSSTNEKIKSPTKTFRWLKLRQPS